MSHNTHELLKPLKGKREKREEEVFDENIF